MNYQGGNKRKTRNQEIEPVKEGEVVFWVFFLFYYFVLL